MLYLFAFLTTRLQLASPTCTTTSCHYLCLECIIYLITYWFLFPHIFISSELIWNLLALNEYLYLKQGMTFFWPNLYSFTTPFLLFLLIITDVYTWSSISLPALNFAICSFFFVLFLWETSPTFTVPMMPDCQISTLGSDFCPLFAFTHSIHFTVWYCKPWTQYCMAKSDSQFCSHYTSTAWTPHLEMNIKNLRFIIYSNLFISSVQSAVKFCKHIHQNV